MEEPEEQDSDDLELPPFDWEKLLRWLLVASLILWVVTGVVGSIIVTYFFGAIGASFPATGSETSSHAAQEIYRLAGVVDSIALRTGVASAAFLIFFWYRRRTRSPEP